MKKLILIFLVIFTFMIIIKTSSAICCTGETDANCYPGRDKCCGDVGYVGCKYATDSSGTSFLYSCPSDTFGLCLTCSEDCKPDGTDCTWIESTTTCDDMGGNCLIRYIEGTKIPYEPASETSLCTTKCADGQVKNTENKCVDIPLDEVKDVICENDDCMSGKFCCKEDGTFDKTLDKEIKGAICSGDNDKDNVCNDYDNCIDVADPEQEDSDNDCGIDPSFFGKCGDLCDTEDTCASAYSRRWCCNDIYEIGITSGSGNFHGYFKDCLEDEGTGRGCWDFCVSGSGDEEIIYESGPCIGGERTIKKIDENGNVLEIIKEPCAGIPLIPFFTYFNLILTLLILVSFYYFRER